MSDTAGPPAGIVFGTAGHFDHGKTALVRSLTGNDTSQLTEEKKRAISIELGFTDLLLPNNKRIAIVDVPGHERFIKNMMAGAAAVDAVLLVIAADEGIRPQTREHFDICRLLRIPRGVIVITKTDLVDAERIWQLEREVRHLCRDSFLESAPCVPVSVQQESGLPELVSQMTSLVDQMTPRPASSFARLSIDRSFTMQGFGTVVTGTLQGGSLNVGDLLEIHPHRQQVRIRSIQVHRRPVARATPGQRTALNLTGIDAQQIQRGSVLTVPETLETTTIFDASVEWLDAKHATRARQSLRLYVGCLETTVDVRLIEQLDGSSTLTRLSSHEPLLILPGDHFILRNSDSTIAGGRVVDPFPPIRANRQKTGERLKRLLSGSDAARLRLLVEEGTQGKKISNLVRLTGWAPAKIRQLAMADETLTWCEAERRIISVAWLEQKQKQVIEWLSAFHRAEPALQAAPMHLLRSSLMSGIEPSLCDFILSGIPEVSITSDTFFLKSRAAQAMAAGAAAGKRSAFRQPAP